MRSQVADARLAEHYADPQTRQQLKPEARWETARGLAMPDAEVARARAGRDTWRHETEQLFERFDVLALPSAQVFPFDAALRHSI